jgi:putative transposase
VPYHRKNTRLPAPHYIGQRIYFLTICCDARKTRLRGEPFVLDVLRLLKECAAEFGFLLHAFCVMPDHIHVLVQGVHAFSDAREFTRLFKQHTAYAFRKISPDRLWEKSYYDYILRPSDSIESVAGYIWWNPVRRGLCVRPEEFPFSGSQTIEWMKSAGAGNSWLAPWKGGESSKGKKEPA